MSNDVIDEVVIKEPYGFIYISTNMVDGKRYLGQKKFREQWQHYLGSGKVFVKAVKKYGKENFVRDIIDIAYSEDELNKKEYDYSVFLNVVESDDWYNLAYGGRTASGFHVSDEAKQKISNKAKERLSNPENHPFYGKHLTDEHKENISKSNKGKIMSIESKEKISKSMSGKNHPLYGISPTYETRQKISKKRKGKLVGKDNPFYDDHRFAGENNPMYGKHHTEETKEKIKSTLQGMFAKEKHPLSTPIFCIELNMFFRGAWEANEIYGFNVARISTSCRDQSKTSGKHPSTNQRLHWAYVYDKVQKDGTVIQGAISLGYITQQNYDDYLNNLKQEGN